MPAKSSFNIHFLKAISHFITIYSGKMFRQLQLLSLLFTIPLAACQTNTGTQELDYIPCNNGKAGEYPCDNIGLYAHIPVTQLSGDYLNDIWGWIDPETGNEYAIVGMNNGVDIVDVTIPHSPKILGKIPEPGKATLKSPEILAHDDGTGLQKNSPWRDVKVHNNTLYIVSEQNDFGLQIFDLTQLRNTQKEKGFFQNYRRYTNFGNAHNIHINNDSEYLYVVGSTAGTLCAKKGGLHILDVSNAMQPEFAGCYTDEKAGGFTADGYIHDTQCIIYMGPDEDHLGREICFNSSEKSFLITDVTDKKKGVTISLSTFTGQAYMHQGWISEDQAYFFMNDELDERRYHHDIRTYVWDIQDLDHPEMIGYYQHDTPGIDHNLYIEGNYMFQANYTAGLRILDVSNPKPQHISEIAFFDTTPGNESRTFSGLWSVYPWLSGDKIIVSDIKQGLFILKFDP